MIDAAATSRRLARWPWWRRPRVLVPASGVLAVGALIATASAYLEWRADRRYREAVAEADRLGPGWRLDDILARREKVPDAENSALRVRDLVRRLPAGWPGMKIYDPRFLRVDRPDVRLDSSQIERLRAVLAPVAEFLPEARALAGFPRGNDFGPRPTIERLERVGTLNAYIDVNFPYGEEVRLVAILLQMDAQLRIEEGDLDSALADARAILCAARSVGDYPGTSGQRVHNLGPWIAVPLLERLLARGAVRTESLAALQTLLEQDEGRPQEAATLRGDRAIVDDFFEQLRAGKVGRDTIPAWSDYPWAYRAFVTRRSLRENQTNLLRINTRAIEVAERPEWDRIDAVNSATEPLIAPWKQARYPWEEARIFPERMIVTSSLGTPSWFAMDRAIRRPAVVALAAERFRLDRGRWPDTLEELVPGYLAALPTDPYINGPIKLRRLDDGLYLYSVGRDRRDDGGTIDWQVRMRVGADHGFRLWNPDHRGRPAGP